MAEVTMGKLLIATRIFPLSISAVHGIIEMISELGEVLMALKLHKKFRGSLSLCSKLGKKITNWLFCCY